MATRCTELSGHLLFHTPPPASTDTANGLSGEREQSHTQGIVGGAPQFWATLAIVGTGLGWHQDLRVTLIPVLNNISNQTPRRTHR